MSKNANNNTTTQNKIKSIKLEEIKSTNVKLIFNHIGF